MLVDFGFGFTSQHTSGNLGQHMTFLHTVQTPDSDIFAVWVLSLVAQNWLGSGKCGQVKPSVSTLVSCRWGWHWHWLYLRIWWGDGDGLFKLGLLKFVKLLRYVQFSSVTSRHVTTSSPVPVQFFLFDQTVGWLLVYPELDAATGLEPRLSWWSAYVLNFLSKCVANTADSPPITQLSQYIFTLTALHFLIFWVETWLGRRQVPISHFTCCSLTLGF